MKTYTNEKTFTKTRNVVLNGLKADFLEFLKEKYGEAAIAFKADGKTKEIVFRAGQVQDKDGNFPCDIYASIDLHVKNWVDTKVSGREVEAYDYEEEKDCYNRVVAEKEAAKEKAKAERAAKKAKSKNPYAKSVKEMEAAAIEADEEIED